MKNGWIKVTEKLPTEKELILLFNKMHQEQHIGWLEGAAFSWGEYSAAQIDDGEISHWQPLPEDPADD